MVGGARSAAYNQPLSSEPVGGGPSLCDAPPLAAASRERSHHCGAEDMALAPGDSGDDADELAALFDGFRAEDRCTERPR